MELERILAGQKFSVPRSHALGIWRGRRKNTADSVAETDVDCCGGGTSRNTTSPEPKSYRHIELSTALNFVKFNSFEN
jgi:hypothetical protein